MKPPKLWLKSYAATCAKTNPKIVNNHNNAEISSTNRSSFEVRNGEKFGSGMDDTFRNYMARKIELQRSQFGLILPPSNKKSQTILQQNQKEKFEINKDDNQETSLTEGYDADDTSKNIKLVRFDDDCAKRSHDSNSMRGLVNQLKRKHGERSGCKTKLLKLSKRKINKQRRKAAVIDQIEKKQNHSNAKVDVSLMKNVAIAPEPQQPNGTATGHLFRRQRPDLFFYGIVVLVNGFTNPSSIDIMRTLHKYGGDLEKYETSRVTHVIAESLSMAKSNIYKRQKRPIPVVKPRWILDCVEAKQLLPHGNYLLDEVREDLTGRKKSVTSFFHRFDENVENLSVELNSASIRDQRRQFETKVDSSKRKTYDSKEKLDIMQNSITKTTEAVSKTLPNHENVEQMNQQNESKFSGGVSHTVGTDPHFLENYFKNSRLSFIGKFKQRLKSTAKNVTLNALNKKTSTKYVFHVDLDCFFAAVSILKYPQYKNKPVAVGHAWKSDPNGVGLRSKVMSDTKTKKSYSELSTCNYIARKYGVKKGMFLSRARELCPGLVVLPYDYEGYERVSSIVGDILYRYTESYNGVVEQVSCDEAYIELYLSDTCHNNIKGKDSFLETVKVIGNRIRKDIFDSTQCTVSVGIGGNKLIAKLATDSVKPNGLCFFQDWKSCLRDVKLRDLPGIGYKMEKKLLQINFSHVRDVWNMGEDAEEELCTILGPGIGKKVFKYCYGEDNRAVQPVARKTIGAECNYGVRFNGPFGVDYMINGLAKEVERRMACVGVVGSYVTLKVKERKPGSGSPAKFNGMGSCNEHSKGDNIPISSGTRDAAVIYRVGMELFSEIGIKVSEVRGMGIIISKLNGAGSKTDTRSIWLKSKHRNSSQNEGSDLKSCTGEKLRIDATHSDSNEKVEFISDVGCHAISKSPNTLGANKLKGKNDKIESSCHQSDKDVPFVVESNKIQGMRKATASIISARDKPIFYDMTLLPYSQNKTSSRDKTLDALDNVSPIADKTIKNLICNRNGGGQEKINLSNEPKGQQRRKDKIHEQKIQKKNTHSKQPDMKRMLKLLSVKSGCDTLKYNGEMVSLTQLGSLPLDMQLQVANNDDISLKRVNASARRSQLRMERKEKGTFEGLDKHVNTNRECPEEFYAARSKKGTEQLNAIDVDVDHCLSEIETSENDEFVLRNWLDSVQNPTKSDTATLQKYLHHCILEKRLDEVVKYLRIIKRRKDAWGNTFSEILQDVIDFLLSTEGRRLDLCWLGLE